MREKQKNTILRQLLEDFAGQDLNLKPSRVGTLDVIGNACRISDQKLCCQRWAESREFYATRVSDLIAEFIDPQPGDTICDPACGSGSLLMKCGRKIVSGHDSRNYALFGQEAIRFYVVAGENEYVPAREDNHKIEWGDTIRNPKLLDKNGDLMLFDIVTANPPFSLDKWGHDEAENDKFGRFSSRCTAED
ncbi:N-6 DNA methylase [Escherichia coli]|nr:N-6 DNA methylase [Escherichia coli]